MFLKKKFFFSIWSRKIGKLKKIEFWKKLEKKKFEGKLHTRAKVDLFLFWECLAQVTNSKHSRSKPTRTKRKLLEANGEVLYLLSLPSRMEQQKRWRSWGCQPKIHVVLALFQKEWFPTKLHLCNSFWFWKTKTRRFILFVFKDKAKTRTAHRGKFQQPQLVLNLCIF